jgi:acyl carrier protein
MTETNNTDKLICELRSLIIDILDLEDISPEEIGADTPLFSEDGLALDSIDAMEIGVALKRRYNVVLDKETQDVDKHFTSLSTLAAFIQSQQN